MTDDGHTEYIDVLDTAPGYLLTTCNIKMCQTVISITWMQIPPHHHMDVLLDNNMIHLFLNHWDASLLHVEMSPLVRTSR